MAKQRRDEEEEYEEPEEEEEEERPRKRGGGAVSHVVPYRNPMALAGYYCGFGALLPALGILLGPLAIILGIVGFVKARNNPEAHGTGHAITAIILGLGSFLICQPIWGVIIWAVFKK
jgi:hypothetical protein